MIRFFFGLWHTKCKTIIRKNDLVQHTTHREAVFHTVLHTIFDAWNYKALWTCGVDAGSMILIARDYYGE